jgi:hypothetical protein
MIIVKRSVVDPHHDTDPDSTYHPDTDPDTDSDFLFDADPDVDQTFHPDADPDPDPDPSFRKKAQTLEKVLMCRARWQRMARVSHLAFLC